MWTLQHGRFSISSLKWVMAGVADDGFPWQPLDKSWRKTQVSTEDKVEAQEVVQPELSLLIRPGTSWHECSAFKSFCVASYRNKHTHGLETAERKELWRSLKQAGRRSGILEASPQWWGKYPDSSSIYRTHQALTDHGRAAEITDTGQKTTEFRNTPMSCGPGVSQLLPQRPWNVHAVQLPQKLLKVHLYSFCWPWFFKQS